MDVRKVLVLAAALAAAVGAVGLAAEGKSGGSAGASAERQAALKTLEAYGFAVEKAPSRLPDFQADLLKGGKASLASYAGKTLVLNFWATWCPPCRAEMPSLQKFRDAARAKGVELLAVSYREDPATVRGFLAKNPYSFPVAVDPTGAVGDRYVTVGIPTTLVVDGAGRLAASVVGGIDWNRPELIGALAAFAGK